MNEHREPRLSIALRALVLAAAAAVLVWPLARGESVAVAWLGALIGAVIGPRLSISSVRTPTILLLAAGAVLCAMLLRHFAVASDWIAPSFGPATSLRIGDAILFGFGALSIATALRALSARTRALAVLEVVAVGLAFAQLVVAHRHGAINRPFEIADPVLAIGGDPATIFIAIGACGATLVVLLLLSENSVLRALLHVVVVAAILLLVSLTTSVLSTPEPPPEQMGLGLRDDPSDDDPDNREQQQGGGRGQRNEDDLEFKDELESQNERVPVAVVLLHDDYSPPSGTYYFRQGAFSQFNGRRLIASTEAGHDRDVSTPFPVAPVEVVDAPPAGAYRATIETTVALLAEHTKPFGLEAPIHFEPAGNPDAERFRRVYKVTSASLSADLVSMLGARPGSPRWSPEDWAHYTSAPTDPRYAELAARMVAELPEHLRDDPTAKLISVVRWLSVNGTYSLRSSHSAAEDPTADFLFGDLTGYCVHFAHAATYLMRTLGLPARVATGYAIDEATRRGGSALLVSGEMSHAWPEVYLDGFGWVVADVSPQTVISPPPPPPDPDLQRLLGELARGLRPVPPEPELEAAVASFKDLLRAILVGLLWLAGGTIVLLYALKLWRAWAPRWARPRSQPRIVYRAVLDRLSDVQLHRLRGESREAFARRLAASLPTLVPLTSAHVGAAFGSDRAYRAPWAEQERAVRAELAKAVPLWRRLVGALIPWSWLLSR